MTTSAVDVSDRIYALSIAISACVAAKVQSNVISDLRQMHAEAQQEARK